MDDFLFFTVMAFQGAVITRQVVRWWLDPSRAVRRRLAKVPRTPLGATREGDWAHVHGTALAQPTLTSPLTHRPCIGYRYVIDNGGKIEEPTAQGGDCASFSLASGGSQALVEGPFEIGLELVPVEPDARPGLLDVLRQARVTLWTDEGYKKLRAREALLLPNASVALLGQVALEVHPRGERESFRDQPMHRVLRGTSARPVLLADGPKAV